MVVVARIGGSLTGKKAFSFTLEEDNVTWLDEYLDHEKNPKGEFRNRSHMVDSLIQEFRQKIEDARGRTDGKDTL